jgi:alginate O-acetyltransferase complex protein AlgI
MSSSSGPYLIFLIVVFFVYWSLANRLNLRLALLAAASCFFYTQAGWRALAILAAVTTIDYTISRAIALNEDRQRRKLLLIISLTSSFGALAIFKYADFFLTSTADLFSLFGLNWQVATLGLIAPIGMSFFIFQSAAYVIDVYRRDTRPAQSLGEYLVYLSFFPTIVAGPIPRANNLLPQLRVAPQLDAERGGRALFLIALGLTKKIAIADYLSANLVERIFDFPERFSALEVAIGVYGYAVQIYADFSGYSDIAIGSALLLGIELPANFDAPYRARSLAEFWRRWHIALSTWLRDYVFFSIAGARARKMSRLYLATIATMLIGGIWHGAAWTFVVWGLLHGIGLCVARALEQWRKRRGLVVQSGFWIDLWRTAVTFHFVCLAWIFFRAETVGGAVGVLRQLTTLTIDTANLNPAALMIIAIGLIGHYLPDRLIEETRTAFTRLPALGQGITLFALAAGLYYVASTDVAPFIYSRF